MWVTRVEKLAGEHIQAFLKQKIAEGVSRATFAQCAAACGKLEVVLNSYAKRHDTGRTYDFRKGIAAARAGAKKTIAPKVLVDRAYTNPAALVAAVGKPEHQLAAAIQYESGARVSEVNMLSERNLQGLGADAATGKAVGVIHVDQCKGGKSRDLQVTPETYARLEAHIESAARLEIDKDAYRGDLRDAAGMTGQKYTGKPRRALHLGAGALSGAAATWLYRRAGGLSSQPGAWSRADLHHVAIHRGQVKCILDCRPIKKLRSRGTY